MKTNSHYVYLSGRAVADNTLSKAQVEQFREERDSFLKNKHADSVIILECFKCTPSTTTAKNTIDHKHDLHCFLCGRNFYHGNDITDYSTFQEPVEVELEEGEDAEQVERDILNETIKLVTNISPEGTVVRVEDNPKKKFAAKNNVLTPEKDGITAPGFIGLSMLLTLACYGSWLLLEYYDLNPF